MKMKNKKKNNQIKGLITLLIILIFLLILVIFLFNKSYISGKAVLNPDIPPNYCTNESINALWDTIFIENSSNITIHFYSPIYNPTNNQVPNCSHFLAYKIKNNISYILSDYYLYQNLTGTTWITAIYGNFTNTYINKLKSITNLSNQAQITSLELGLGNYTQGFIIPEKYFNKRPNKNISNASYEFNQTFKISSGTLTKNITNDLTSFKFEVNESGTSNDTYLYQGSIHSNYTSIFFYFFKTLKFECIPNWIPRNNTCDSSEIIVNYYDSASDINNCNQTPPANTTLSCDYNNDNILGNPANIKVKINNATSENLSIFINESSNLTNQNFTNKYEKVEIKGTNKTYVEFYWNFSSPLDINKIYIEKQSSGNKGYLIINNLSANKTIYVDRLNSSNYICVKKSEVRSIDSISTECNRSNEILFECPETINNIKCELLNSSFKISGLTNSGAIEYITNESECISNWNCTNFSECSDNIQTRICIDINNCSDTSTKPELFQECDTETIACTPAWNCTEWSNCKNATQTRTCIDKKDCEPEKIETKQCEKPERSISKPLYILIITIIIIAIAIVSILLFLQLSKKQKNNFVSNY